jgi:hypothetical protein
MAFGERWTWTGKWTGTSGTLSAVCVHGIPMESGRRTRCPGTYLYVRAIPAEAQRTAAERQIVQISQRSSVASASDRSHR